MRPSETLLPTFWTKYRTVGERERLFFNCLRWEDFAPGLGSNVQAVIDEQLGSYNILVGIMWMHFGTPIPGGADSGTEHEIQQAVETWNRIGEPRVMFYFKDDPPAELTSINPVQLQKVQEFRKRLGSGATTALVQTFRGTSQFEIQAESALEQARGLPPAIFPESKCENRGGCS